WSDANLAWNESEYNNIPSIVVMASDVWIPDVSVKNGFFDGLTENSLQEVIISSKGEMSLDLLKETTTFCKLDLTYFPFDVQTCYIGFDIWAYTKEQVVSILGSLWLLWFWPEGEPNIVDAQQNDAFYNDGTRDMTYSEVNFVIHLKRNPLFHVTYFIYPCLISSVATTFVFLVPSDTNQKIEFSTTILISFSVFLNTMYFSLPKSGDYIPFLAFYVVFVIFISSLSVFFTVFVLILHY
ncbi:hypothetical protein HELRODRAFT_142296, partial [Helobdella robusta]|uniref:Neurotransmitter-gated ion-channel ligand-binding domain-containing protein n=1 Tax=Helobdella robusta TaxID=6412 RepID=T1EJ54_HELRO